MSDIHLRLRKLKHLSDFVLADTDYGWELLRGLNELRKSETFCDVFLKVKPEDQGLAVHKDVLVATSPYFKSLLNNATRSSTTACCQHIVLKDLSSNALKEIVEYIYSGLIKITAENCLDIFEASFLLQLDTLRSVSEFYLKKCIRPLNCLRVMSSAYRHNSQQLLEKARECVAVNFSQILDSSEFLTAIDARNLKMIISSDHLMTKSEDEVYKAVKRWIEYDLEGRLKYVPLLMSQVRFRFMPQEFLSSTYKQDVIMNVSPLCEDFVYEALMFDKLPLKEREKVHTMRVRPRWCTQVMEVILLAGGICVKNELRLSKTLAYDPVGAQWYLLDSLPYTRQNFALVQCDGSLLIFGGQRDPCDEKFLTTVEQYDAKLNKWKSFHRKMKEGRCRFDAVCIGEVVYLVGGMCGDPCRNFLETYVADLPDASEGADSVTVEHLSSPHVPRYNHCTSVMNGKIYVIGGNTRGHVVLKTVACYDPDTNTWSDVASLLVPRSGACAVTVDDSIVVIGGSSLKKPLSSCEIYDSKRNKWENIAPMNECRDCCTAVYFKNKIYVFGGSYGRINQHSVECYSLKANKWRVVTHVPVSMYGFKCIRSVVNRSLVQKIAFEQV